MIVNDVQGLDFMSKIMKKIIPILEKTTHFSQFALFWPTRSQNYEKKTLEDINSTYWKLGCS